MRLSRQPLFRDGRLRERSRRVLSALALLALTAPVVNARATDAPRDPVRRLGKTVMEFRNDAIQVVIGYKYASANLKSKWIFLDTYVSVPSGKPVSVYREDISLVTPSGPVWLPSQKKMAEGIPDLRRLLTIASVSRDPLLGYFPSATRQQRLGFFTIPGEDIVFDRFVASHDTVTIGDLFFQAEKDTFEPGDYALIFTSKEVNMRLPFRLPADDVPKKKKTDPDSKTVPW